MSCFLKPLPPHRRLASILLLVASLLTHWNGSVQAADPADGDSGLEAIYGEKTATFGDSAEGQFDLGHYFYTHQAKSLEGLSLAKRAFKLAAGHFEITTKSGTVISYNVLTPKDGEWGTIAADYGEAIENAHEYIVLQKTKKKTEKTAKKKTATELTADEQMDALQRISTKKSAPVNATVPIAYDMLSVVGRDAEKLDEKLHPDYWEMIFAVVGGLGIFLIGMKSMSEGIQAVAGSRLRKMISAVTNNRFAAVGVGSLVTCMIQSSSITTVIVVGFVNGGLMLLHQAIGVIMGANIGTTITGWILVLKIGKYGLPILGVAAFFYLMSKRERIRYTAMAIMGLGMVFFGLEMMKNGFKPMSGVPQFEATFRMFDAHTYLGVLKCAAIGCLLTFIVQSSSATLGITIGLASTGIIPFETAAALVLGENIGTTITAWLASLGATTNAKRAAYFHVLFNMVGAFWVTAVFAVYIKIVGAIIASSMGESPLNLVYGDVPDKLFYAQLVTTAIAATHTIFNLTNTVLFLPFVRFFARLLERLVPDKGTKEVGHLQSLDMRMVESPAIAIEQSRGELAKLGDGLVKMMDWTRTLLNSDEPDAELTKKVFHREEVMDQVQVEVTQFLTELMSGNISHGVANEGRIQIRVVDEMESVSDYISELLKAYLTLRNNNLKIPDAQQQELNLLHDEVANYVKLVSEGFRLNKPEIVTKAHSQGEGIKHQVRSLRKEHLERMSEEKMDPSLTLSYIGMLNAYRKIKDHLQNVAEAMASEF
jgi:phosphate:Na+ symporter